ncbi:DUF2642 domain-containing protein [Priestia megaterium]|uniref:DUF2642 domain-containing protein n=1 Tax=Priestia megaterium TaxID=1404 RepID=UPI0013EBC414|nr:DUF2642 domain-containing protein [Priestia megaterium]
MALSSAQRTELLRRLLELPQNLTNSVTNSSSGNISLDLPGVDVNINLPLLGTGASTPSTPTDLRSYLSTLLNEQVEITTPGDTNTGTLVAVKSDYIALIESSGTTVLIPISSIETVRKL